MKQIEWRKQIDGAFTARKATLFLKVRTQPDCPYTRFLVQAGRPDGERALIGSGSTMTINDGMKAAEHMAERFIGTLYPARVPVLLVDHDPLVRDTMAAALRDAGYQVIDAASGGDALRQMKRGPEPAVIITDITLGSEDGGLEFAGIARRIWPEAGLLLVSGDARPRPGHLHCDGFLVKPFSTDQFLKLVGMIFRGNHRGR
jgi:CheY-like chemotaxis protein